MLLWVGLGNPGEKYQKQRHNIGFMIVEKIASQHSFAPWKNKMKARICVGKIAGQKIILLKPQLFINKSGEPLSQVARFYKISLDSILVTKSLIIDCLLLAPNNGRFLTSFLVLNKIS